MKNYFDFVTDFIFAEDDIIPADIILIPGGSHPQLAEKAAELFGKGMAKYILASGRANASIPDYPSEAEYLKSVAVKCGVAPADFICENEASNTFENAEFSLAELERRKIKAEKIILVCKAYHARRALLTYQCIFPQSTRFYVAPAVDKRGLSKDNWFLNPAHIEKVMGEVEKIGRYFKSEVAKMNGLNG